MWLRHEARTKTPPSSEFDRRLAALRAEIREAMGCPATDDDGAGLDICDIDRLEWDTLSQDGTDPGVAH